MTTQFEDTMKSVAAYAKAVNFNPETGDFMAFMGEWIRKTQKDYNFLSDNEDVYRLVKSLCK
jgi:hypothetical protein